MPYDRCPAGQGQAKVCSALYLAPQYAVEHDDSHRNKDRDVLKSLFAEHADILQMGKAKHDRQHAQGDDDRINQTLFVGHYGIPENRSKGGARRQCAVMLPARAGPDTTLPATAPATKRLG